MKSVPFIFRLQKTTEKVFFLIAVVENSYRILITRNSTRYEKGRQDTIEEVRIQKRDFGKRQQQEFKA